MSNFLTVHQGRLHAHVLAVPRFNTRNIVVKMTQPIRRESVTATALLPYLWLEGTASYPTARQLILRSEELYGTVLRSGISKRGDQHVAEIAATMPDEAVVGVDGLFQDVNQLVWNVATNPAKAAEGFPDVHVQRERTLHKKRIESLTDDKIAYAYERCVAEVCRDVPAGLPRLGYLEDLQSLTGSLLWSTHESLLQESDIHIYVTGALEDAEQTAKAVLEQWSALGGRQGTDSQVVEPVAKRQSESVHQVFDRQPVNQGKLNLGICTGVSCADANYPALMMANGILGGFPFSKLFMNVREKASLAYYARSGLDGLTGVITIQTGIEVSKYEQALTIISDQIEVLKQGKITAEEFDLTKRGLRNQFTQLNDSPGSLIDFHFTGALVNRERTVDGLLGDIDSVSMEDVVEAAQTLKVDTMYFLGNLDESDVAKSNEGGQNRE